MAQKITVDGKVDDKPMSQEAKTKVHDALKSTIEKELTVIRPTHHWSVTHIDVTFE